MNPPLRTAADRDAIIMGLADGTIDVIATDHAPHVSEDKKDVEFEAASFGVVGLETAVGIVMTYLVHKDILMPSDLVEKMSIMPNRVLRTPGGTLSVGSPADVTIIDPTAVWTVEPQYFFSKARNTPFEGYRLQGNACCTILDGRVVYERSRT
jgi:dihydroorotase